MSTEPDRLHINKLDKKIYDRLKQSDSPFAGKGNKELFLMAMVIGFKEGVTRELDKKEGYVRTSYLSDEEKSLIKALAIHNTGTLSILLDKEKVFSIAEQYAAYGIRLLHDSVLGGDYGAYAKRLEAELVKTFEDVTEDKGVERQGEASAEIRELIEKGESENIEFKSSMCWDYKKKQRNKLMEYTIAKSVSAFMNSEGGVLLIGVGDDRQILGLDQDFIVIKKPSKDVYQLHFTNVINKYLGKENRPYAKMRFVTLDNKIVSVVTIKKSPNPVYVKADGEEEFFVRLGNSSHPLNVRQATAYIKKHWG